MQTIYHLILKQMCSPHFNDTYGGRSHREFHKWSLTGLVRDTSIVWTVPFVSPGDIIMTAQTWMRVNMFHSILDSTNSLAVLRSLQIRAGHTVTDHVPLMHVSRIHSFKICLIYLYLFWTNHTNCISFDVVYLFISNNASSTFMREY